MTRQELIDSFPANRRFTKQQIESIFTKVLGKTLGEADKNHVFNITVTHPKVTGIAGMVVEQSILGYPADHEQKADILVDNEPTEVKTTGIVKPRDKKSTMEYEAKEPVSVTAVSIDTIGSEVFEESHFWEKLEHLLFVFYLYDSKDRKIVIAADYAKFPIMGYELHEFSLEDKERLKNDWMLVHDFIVKIQTDYTTEEDRKQHYPLLSSALRKDLMLIDTAPKYPNPPRFRLKRVFVSTIVNDYFTKGGGLEKLSKPITRYSEIDSKCHYLAEAYRGKTVKELYELLGIDSTPKGKGRGELIVIKMFGGNASNISSIEDFAKIGLLAKTITYKDGKKKEDMKLIPVDFEEWTDEDIDFEDSEIYSYFSDHSFIYVLFNHDTDDSSEDKFVGFKRFSFSDDFIENDVRTTWNEVRDLVNNHKLKLIQEKDSRTGKPKLNKSGSIREATNFPKSKDHNVFLRGSGTDSSDKYKTEEVNGLRMLKQYVWVRGSYLNEQLQNLPFL